MEKKQEKNFGNILMLLIEVAIVGVVVFRKYIFPSDSLFFCLYDAAYAEDTMVRVIKTVYLLALGALIIKVADLVTLMGEKFENNKTKTSLLLLGNVLKYASAVGVLFVGLTAWGIDTTAIATGAGVITLIVGLGCQSMISDIVSGIFILFEGDIQVGDIVVVDGWRGTVRQIGLRRTKIEDTSGNINIVNNSAISNVVNNTKELSWACSEFVIDYKESVENLEKVLRDNFEDMKNSIPTIVDGPYYLGVSALKSYGYEVIICAHSEESALYQTQRDMNRYLLLLLNRNDITIAAEHVSISNRDLKRETVNFTDKEILEAKAFLEEQRKHTKNIDESMNK